MEGKKLCKVCKKNPRYANLGNCYQCQKKWERTKRELKKERAKIRKAKSKERRKNSFPILKRELDKIFSLFIRQRDGKCFTCNVVLPVAQLQNGHYVPRQHLSLRWDERNCNAQCMPCNVFKKGAMDEYAANLLKKYGPTILEKLLEEKRRIVKFTTMDLQKLIETYRNKTS